MTLFSAILGVQEKSVASDLFSAKNRFRVTATDALKSNRELEAVKSDRQQLAGLEKASSSKKRDSDGELVEDAAEETSEAALLHTKKRRKQSAQVSTSKSPSQLASVPEPKEPQKKRKASKKAAAEGLADAQATEERDLGLAGDALQTAKKDRKEKRRLKLKATDNLHITAETSETKDALRIAGADTPVARQSKGSGEALPGEIAEEDAVEQLATPRVRKTPEEEAEQLTRTVFVGNLPVVITKRQLKSIFSESGKIESIRLRSIPIQLEKMIPRRAAVLSKKIATDRGTAHAYIVFQNIESVATALKHNMEEVNGLHIRVDKAGGSTSLAGGSSIEFNRTHSVFLGNLPFNVEDEDVIRLFNDGAISNESVVTGVRVVRDRETNIGKGFGFVLFNSKEAARMALARDGTELKGRPIRVTRAAGSKSGLSANDRGAKRLEGALRRLAHADLKRKAQGTSAKEQFEGTSKRSGPRSAVSWQGIRTKGTKRVARSSAAAPKNSSGRRTSGGTAKNSHTVLDSKKRTGKRPAVAARKAKMLGLPVPKQLTEKQKLQKQKRRKYTARG